MIVIEGPDASGKSTLAKYLSEMLDVRVYTSEGPPRFPGDLPERIKKYNMLPSHTICDRHPCVSDLIYAKAFNRHTDVTSQHTSEFYAHNHIIIYCDPIPNTQHVTKPHDTTEHLQNIERYTTQLHDYYREWALQRAHIFYRIGDRMDRIATLVAPSMTKDIEDFHRRFLLIYQGKPRRIPEDIFKFRLRFMAEELCEYAGVPEVTKQLIQSALENEATPIALTDQFDALIDLVYVALGTSYLHGFPFQAGWSRVHKANMLKVRALNANESRRHSIYDIVKPPNWQAPTLEDLIE